MRVFRVDRSGILFRCGLEVEGAQIRRLEFDGHCAFFLLPLEFRRHDSGLVFGEGCRHGCDTEFFAVAREQHVFAAEEKFSVRRFRAERVVIERKEESIVERHPAEMRRVEAAPHRHAIGKFRLDAQPVEHPGGIIVALLLANFIFGGEEFLHMRVAAIVVFISPQRFPGRKILRILRARHGVRHGGLQGIAG